MSGDIVRNGRKGDGALLAPYRRHWMQRHSVALMIGYLAFTFIYSVAFSLIGRFFPIPFVAPVVVLGLFVIWALPTTDKPPLRTLEFLLFAMIVALFSWPDYLALAVGNLPWITLMRTIVFPLGLCLLVTVSVSPSFRAYVGHRLDAIRPVGYMMAGVAILGLVTVPLASNLAGAGNRYVILLFNWVIPFFVSIYVFSKQKRIVWLAHILWILATLVCLIGFWEWKTGAIPWAEHIPSFLKVEDPAVQRVLAGSARAATGIHRVQSRFTTSLALAEFISYSLPFIVHIICTSKSFFIRMACVVSVPLILFVNVKTDSRIGFIGLVMTVLLYAFGWFAIRWVRNKDSILAPGVMLAYPFLMVATIVSTFFVPRMRAQVWGNGPQTASNETRRQMYEQGVPLILREPWVHGLGEAARKLGFQNGNGVITLDTYYITVGLELGLIGLILYYGMFLISIVRSFKATVWAPDRDTQHLLPIAVTLSNFFVIKSVFSQPENHPLIFCLLGASLALLSRVYDAVPEARPAGRDDIRSAPSALA